MFFALGILSVVRTFYYEWASSIDAGVAQQRIIVASLLIGISAIAFSLAALI